MKHSWDGDRFQPPEADSVRSSGPVVCREQSADEFLAEIAATVERNRIMAESRVDAMDELLRELGVS